MRKSGLALLLLIVLGNLAAWAALNRPQEGEAWSGIIRGVSFSPFQADDDPLQDRHPTSDDIARDLDVLDGRFASVRTYSALDGLDVVPALARKHGVKVTAGAWIDASLGRNEAELRSIMQIARGNRNVERVIVGNESLYRDDVTVQQLIRYIRRVRDKVAVPVSTAEPWHVWLDYPELAQEVDFIAIHILPYWEGIAVEHALDFLLARYDEVKRRFPGKHVVITEVGWPSAGKSRKDAVPSLVNQAMFLRAFLNAAHERDIDYNIIEAFDQPWKKSVEWAVGANWGLYDAQRQAKFAWDGAVVEMAEWPALALAATLLALLPMAFFLSRLNHLRKRGRLFFGILVQGAASFAVWVAAVPLLKDFAPSMSMLLLVLLPAQAMLLVVVLINGLEFAELTWVRRAKRRFLPFTPDTPKHFPKVSLHLCICNEPAEMVKLTIDSLVRLDYPNFEVLVVDNNTKDPAVWRPVEEYCRQFANVRFFSLGKWPGFKAGALNFALKETAADAEIVGVVDSDYVVDKDWLRSLVPYFDNPKTGWVQAPQDHREWQDDAFKEMINWEYAGFFHIGMVARNEANAIIQHGTMTLIRRTALEETGRWGEWCICEDAELGLRLLKDGYESVYVNHRFGHGLTPDTYAGYRKQRFRWAFGAMQIMKGHWRALMPFARSGLTPGQKYHFVAGWLPWIADALFLLFAAMGILWSAGLVASGLGVRLPGNFHFDFPPSLFLVPTVGVFAAKLAHHMFLYSTRVNCTWPQRIGSAVAGMALTYAIALAVWQGVFKKSTPFLRTPKCEDKAALARGVLMAWEETALMLLHWGAAAAVLAAYGREDPDARLWALVMMVQSLPFAAALVTSMVSVVPKSGRRAAVQPQLAGAA